MPSHRCKHPTCNELLTSVGYCTAHQPVAQAQEAAKAADYNRFRRDPEARKFYNSAAWKNTRDEYIRQHPICERCTKVIASHVHHKVPLDRCSEAQKLDPANLMSVCPSCHNILEAQTPADDTSTAIGTIHPVEDDEFYFDAEAADRVIRFIEKFCHHYEGRFAGRAFILLEWQRDIVRTLFGWKHRTTHLRRFRELYLITAKGAGKSPMIAAIGLYMLLADGEAGAHVISMASSFEQASITFDGAKKYIGESEELSKHKGIRCKQFSITAPKYSKWTTISGKPNGRSGPRPSCIIADEAHEWPPATGIAFDLLCANLFKRSQPLLMVATNAGADRTCYAWQLHERAAAVINGTNPDKTILPVIFEAPKALDWRSEEAAKAANPSLGEIVSFDQLKPEQSKGEARYRRLYLSQWVTGVDKWLDLTMWDSCVKPFDPATLKDAPLYVGLDLSQSDDLCAATFIYPTPKIFYVDSRFWVPRPTADRYEENDLIPYSTWEDENAITLLDERTISTNAQAKIAAEIIAMHKIHPITAVCYDRAYASGTIAGIEAEGITCTAIGQGWGVSTGTTELERRLKEQSIQIAPNSVMRFCAQNVEVSPPDKHGNYWPVKPNANRKTGYAGKKSHKIDGIASLVTALTEARRTSFPKPAPHVGAFLVEL